MDEEGNALLDAFFDLCTERQIGATVGPIPLSKIKDYAREEMDLDDADEFDRFVAIMRKVDGGYMSMFSASGSDDPKLSNVAPPSDPKATHAMLQRLGKKPQKQKVKTLG